MPGEGVGMLGGSLTFVTTATAASHVGHYSVVPTGLTSNNYAIQFVGGTLTVTPPGGVMRRARASLVTTLYRELLGRVPEPAGLAYWVKVLSRGVCAHRVASSIWRSPERQTLLTQGRALHIRLAVALGDALRARQHVLKIAKAIPPVLVTIVDRGPTQGSKSVISF